MLFSTTLKLYQLGKFVGSKGPHKYKFKTSKLVGSRMIIFIHMVNSGFGA